MLAGGCSASPWSTLEPVTDPLDDVPPVTCPTCGTVMRDTEGGYECGWDGTTLDVPWVERPTSGDDLPNIR